MRVATTDSIVASDVAVIVLLHESKEAQTRHISPVILAICHGLIEKSSSLDSSVDSLFQARTPQSNEIFKHLASYYKGCERLQTAAHFSEYLVQWTSNLLLTAKTKHASVLSIFLRKMILTLRQMNFEELQEVYHAWRSWFVNFEEKVKISSVATQFNQQGPKNVLQDRQPSDNSRSRSAYAAKIQSIEPATQTMSQNSMSANDQIYLQFLQAWRGRDYYSSLSQLSRYFDYTSASANYVSYPHALLNLALLQADFGCYSEALWAIYETIDAARDSMNDICLDYALSWLHELSADLYNSWTGQSLGRYSEITKQILSRAQTNNLPVIESVTQLMQATWTSGLGAVQSIRESMRISTMHDLKLTSAQYESQLALWDYLDVPILARITHRVSLTLCCTTNIGHNLLADGAYHSPFLDSLGLNNQTGETRESSAFSQEFPRNSQVRVPVVEATHDPKSNLWFKIEEIRRLIAQKALGTAWNELEKHLCTESRSGVITGGNLKQIKYLRLKSEILRESSEPERAILVAAEAMRLSYDHAFFREFREIQEALSEMAKIFQE